MQLSQTRSFTLVIDEFQDFFRVNKAVYSEMQDTQLVDGGALDKDAMIKYIVGPNSTFLNEGKNNLIEEFGKDYGIYFSILSCIARGKNTRSEIEDVIGKEVGGYLTNLAEQGNRTKISHAQ